jgi:hypothetical protein
MKEKLVLIGNGMAGVRTLEELLKLAPDQYDITVFGGEPYGNYNRILLSPVLAGEKTIDEIMLTDEQWYADNAITLHKGKLARGVIGTNNYDGNTTLCLSCTKSVKKNPTMHSSQTCRRRKPTAMEIRSSWSRKMIHWQVKA